MPPLLVKPLQFTSQWSLVLFYAIFYSARRQSLVSTLYVSSLCRPHSPIHMKFYENASNGIQFKGFNSTQMNGWMNEWEKMYTSLVVTITNFLNMHWPILSDTYTSSGAGRRRVYKTLLERIREVKHDCDEQTLGIEKYEKREIRDTHRQYLGPYSLGLVLRWMSATALNSCDNNCD